MVILFGFKGCGKSYWGEKLAAALEVPFVDTDRVLEARIGLSCRSLYQKWGERGFREEEHALLHTLKPGGVIAVGGGTVLETKNLPLLREVGRLVYLKVGRETLESRFSPFAHYTTFETFYEERLPLYEAIEAECVEEPTLEKLLEVRDG